MEVCAISNLKLFRPEIKWNLSTLYRAMIILLDLGFAYKVSKRQSQPKTIL